MTTPAKAEARAIRLALSVSGGGDAFGPFFATLTAEREIIERLLRRADVHRTARRMETELYQTTYFDYSVEFFESGRDDDDCTPEYAAQIKQIFEDEDYPTDGIWEADPAKLTFAEGNVRFDYCKLIISSSCSRERTMVDFYWIACIKHTDVEINTAEIKEEYLRELLGKVV